MRVEQTQQAATVTAQSGLATGVAKNVAKTPFATVLAKSTGTATTGTGQSNTTPTTGTVETDKAKSDKSEQPIPKGPKGETTQAVKDHPAFVEVTAGPRNGMFINMTGNERSGEAFVLAKRDDRDLHIYGTGKDRRVIISWHKDQPAHRAEYDDAGHKQADKAEKTTKPVSGGAAPPSA